MAPKANKRAGSAVAASPKKRSKVDPMFAGIVATLQGADTFSEQCREMLVLMTSPSLSTPKSERHSVQQLGVTMIEEVLEENQRQLVEAVAAAQRELSEIEGTKGALVQCLETAKAALDDKQAAKTTAHAAHEEAKAATKAAEAALEEQVELQRKGDESYASLEKEKADLDAAYQEHFKAPMDANEPPHHSFLKPFIENLGLEDSLMSALPSSCIKPKEQRGGFDELVLTEVSKAMTGKIASLEKRIADEASGSSERKAAVAAAEAELEAKKTAESTAAADLKAASTAEVEAVAEVSKASSEWEAFEPKLQAATDNVNQHDAKRLDFVEGTLKEFAALRDKEAAVPKEQEAATLGA